MYSKLQLMMLDVAEMSHMTCCPSPFFRGWTVPHCLTFVQRYTIINQWPNLSIGEIKGVEGTPFDLRKPVVIGPQLKEVPSPGFDHNFCLSSPGDAWTERHAARFAAEVISF